MAPHLVWLVQNDFLPFAYAERARRAVARTARPRAASGCRSRIGQLVFLLPALLIAAAAVLAAAAASTTDSVAADAFDRRIVTLLAFGPARDAVALSAVSGRGTIAMWGYPLWLFLGLWIVLYAPRRDRAARAWRASWRLWAAVFAVFAIAFVANYAVLPRYRPPLPRGASIPATGWPTNWRARFRAATGPPLDLCDRHHVGRRQCRALRAASSRAC